jgi:hypothetical protein
MDYPCQVAADEIAGYDAMDIPDDQKIMLTLTKAEHVFRLPTRNR